MAKLPATLPGPGTPIVQNTDQVTGVWWLFFSTLLARTGGLAGVDVTTLVPSVAATVAPVVGASPYSYTATARGMLVVTGGTVSSVIYTRTGSPPISLPTSGQFPMNPTDRVTVTYTAVPVVTFVPL